LFNGKKINIGDTHRPFYTNSLQTIITHLQSSSADLLENITGIDLEMELSGEDEVYINQVMNSVKKRSHIVLDTLSTRLYRLLQLCE